MYEFLLAGTDIFVCLTLLGRNTPLMHLVCLKFKPEEEPVAEFPAGDACVVVLDRCSVLLFIEISVTLYLKGLSWSDMTLL